MENKNKQKRQEFMEPKIPNEMDVLRNAILDACAMEISEIKDDQEPLVFDSSMNYVGDILFKKFD
jgi:hypothetical protein